jgi:hypothetical protein
MRAVSRWQVLGYVSFDEPDSSGLTISLVTFPKGRIGIPNASSVLES